MNVNKPSKRSLIERSEPLNPTWGTVTMSREKADLLTTKLVDEGEVVSSHEKLSMAVDGGVGVFVWADKLYAIHTATGDFVRDVEGLRTRINFRRNTQPRIGCVYVLAPDDTDGAAVKEQLEKWTGDVSITVKTYPYKPDVEQDYELYAEFHHRQAWSKKIGGSKRVRKGKGKVEVASGSGSAEQPGAMPISGMLNNGS